MRPEGLAQARVIKARTQLVLDEPFFGLLASRLRLKEDFSCRDMWTDSVYLGFNPRYVEELADVELRGIIAHVVMHIAAGHPWRQGERKSKPWNDAADLAINHVLVEAGFRLPPGALLDPEYKGQPAELIYPAMLAKEQEQEEPPPGAASSDGEGEPEGDTDGAGDTAPQPGEPGQDAGGNAPGAADSESGAPGEVRPAPQDSPEADWKMAVQAAAQQQGRLPAGLQRLVDIGLKARVDWREALRHLIQTSVYSPDYSWSRPNRRWLHQGLYLPGMEGKNIACMVIARDTSASIGDAYMEVFNAEIVDILMTYNPDVTYVVDCDAKVAQVIQIEPGDLPDSLSAQGGGGTRFEPVFDWIEEQGLNPSCVVYLTDLEGSFPSKDPGYPVIWTVPEGHYKPKAPPFGDLLGMTLD